MFGTILVVLIAVTTVVADGPIRDFSRKPVNKKTEPIQLKPHQNSTELKHVKTVLARLILASMLQDSNTTDNQTSTVRRFGWNSGPVRKIIKGASRVPPFWSVKSDLTPPRFNQVGRNPSMNPGESLPILSTTDFGHGDLNKFQLLLLDDMNQLKPGTIPSGILPSKQEGINNEHKSESMPPSIKTADDLLDSPRCDKFTQDICLDDSEYPRAAIMNTIYQQRNKFDLMYAEAKERENQVEGLTRKQEESLTFEHYFGPLRYGATKRRPVDYGSRGGFICPSEVTYSKPHRAKNRVGEWKVIINVAEFTQTLRLEKCLRPDYSCSYVSDQYQSSCSQIYSYHRLMVFDKEKGLHIDMFKMPTGCTCFIKGSKFIFPHPPPKIPSESIHQARKPNGKLSHVLSSIFSTNKLEEQIPPNPQVLNYIQRQLALVRYLNQNPQLMEYVSPTHVLEQLLNEDDPPPPPRQPPKRLHPSRWHIGRQPMHVRNMIQHPSKINREKLQVENLISSDDEEQYSEPLDEKVGFRPILKPTSQLQASDTETSQVSTSQQHPNDQETNEPSEDSDLDDKSKEARINFSYHPILEYLS